MAPARSSTRLISPVSPLPHPNSWIELDLSVDIPDVKFRREKRN